MDQRRRSVDPPPCGDDGTPVVRSRARRQPNGSGRENGGPRPPARQPARHPSSAPRYPTRRHPSSPSTPRSRPPDGRRTSPRAVPQATPTLRRRSVTPTGRPAAGCPGECPPKSRAALDRLLLLGIFALIALCALEIQFLYRHIMRDHLRRDPSRPLLGNYAPRVGDVPWSRKSGGNRDVSTLRKREERNEPGEVERPKRYESARQPHEQKEAEGVPKDAAAAAVVAAAVDKKDEPTYGKGDNDDDPRAEGNKPGEEGSPKRDEGAGQTTKRREADGGDNVPKDAAAAAAAVVAQKGRSDPRPQKSAREEGNEPGEEGSPKRDEGAPPTQTQKAAEGGNEVPKDPAAAVVAAVADKKDEPAKSQRGQGAEEDAREGGHDPNNETDGKSQTHGAEKGAKPEDRDAEKQKPIANPKENVVAAPEKGAERDGGEAEKQKTIAKPEETRDDGPKDATDGDPTEMTDGRTRWNLRPPLNYTLGSRNQRVLFLAGPHKTGSSTFQTVATHFTNVYPKWALNDPWDTFEHRHDVIKLDKAKHFSALIFPMIGQGEHPLFVNPPVDEGEMLRLFKEDLKRKWESKDKTIGDRNIVMGSEEVDQILAGNLDGEEVLNKLLSVLPPAAREVTEVVVTYRSPKAKHLISLWKEVGVQMWNETMTEFIFNPEAFLHVHTIEPLPLLDMFLQRGMRVVLVDIGGLKRHGVEPIQLMGCDLMREPCSPDEKEGMLPDFLKEALVKYPDLMTALKASVNVRNDGVMDLDDGRVAAMERAMRRYDCGYRDAVAGHANLTILYDADFVANMDACERQPRRIGRRELWNEIKAIADPGRAAEERRKKVVLFAGPHFSATGFMHILSIHFSAIMREKWAWVAPPAIKQYFQLTEPAYLASLLFALSGQTSHPLFTSPKVTKELIYDIFKEDLARLFAAEKNVLLGSEEIDCVSSRNFDGEGILGELMALLTPDLEGMYSYYETTVVVGYAPRADHLLSLWNEVGKPAKQSVYEFTRDPNSINHLHTIDPLSLVDKFLKRGAKVVLIDVTGHAAAGAEAYKTLACDIMQEPCDSNRYPNFIDEHRKVHPDIMDAITIDPTIDATKDSSGATLRRESGLSERQMTEIDKELRRYDCNFRHALGHENVTVLYDVAFSKNMGECSDDAPFVSREDMWTVVSSWADPIHDAKASLRASLMRHPG